MSKRDKESRRDLYVDDGQADPRPIRGRPRLVRGLYAPAGTQPRVPRNGRVIDTESADSDPRIFTFSTADIPEIFSPPRGLHDSILAHKHKCRKSIPFDPRTR